MSLSNIFFSGAGGGGGGGGGEYGFPLLSFLQEANVIIAINETRISPDRIIFILAAKLYERFIKSCEIG